MTTNHYDTEVAIDSETPHQKRFKAFLLSMNFHDMGSCYVRGDFVIEASVGQDEIRIEELRVGQSAIDDGEIDAFLDMLFGASSEWGVPLRIRAKGFIKETLIEWGCKEDQNSFNILTYNPSSAPTAQDGGAVKMRTLVALSALVLVLLLWKFLK